MNKTRIRYFIIHTLQILLRLFSYSLPIKNNQIIFSSFSGTTYACNPKYISKELEQNNKYRIYWCIQKGTDRSIFPLKVSLVEKHSVKYIYTFLTSKIIFDNDAVPLYMPVRKKQVYINTWHGGGAFKKTGFSAEKIDDNIHLLLKENARKPDYFISSSSKSSKLVIKSDLGYQGKILKIGMPRNDVLFADNLKLSIKEKIREIYGIDFKEKIVIYAPTFRPDEKVSRGDIDSVLLLQSLNCRFGGNWVLLVRAHHRYRNLVGVTNAIDVTDYPDMQELLVAADVFITDYSSCMWDFSLMNKPCFILANDLGDYNKQRGFHIPIENWPYPIAKDNAELANEILMFSLDEYSRKVRRFLEHMGSYENGKATESIAAIINHICMGEEDEEFFKEYIE